MADKFRPVRVQYSRTALRQVVWRFREVDDTPAGFCRRRFSAPEEIRNYDFLFRDLPHERVVVFVLNSKHDVNCVDIVSEGVLNSALMHPREVFRSAVAGLGVAIVVAHNHPSGDPEPSSEDVQITRQLVKAGEILNIPLLDHIVVAGDKYVSLAEKGLL